MTEIAYVYKDAGLTELFDDAVDTLDAQAVNGASGYGVFYVGSPDEDIKIQATSDPGIDPIEISIDDASPGSGVEDTHIKLSLSSDFSGSTGGASLSLGATINGGVGNAVPVYYQWSNSIGAGTYTEISLGIVARDEYAI